LLQGFVAEHFHQRFRQGGGAQDVQNGRRRRFELQLGLHALAQHFDIGFVLLEAFEQVRHKASTRNQKGVGHGVDGGFAKSLHLVIQRVVVKGHGGMGSVRGAGIVAAKAA